MGGLIQPGPVGLCGRVEKFLQDRFKGGPHWLVEDAVRQGPAGAPFVWFRVAKLEMAQALVTARCALKGTASFLFEVLTPEEQRQHDALWPLFLAARGAGKRAQFRRAVLLVGGKPVRLAAA